jgi:uncharacterized protein YecA (UPF0149 family)
MSQSPNLNPVLHPRLEKILTDFLALPDPQEGPPLAELVTFPEDLPHLQKILLDYYHWEPWVQARENSWKAPIFAWRALGLFPDPSSIPVLLEALELADEDDSPEYEQEEIPPLLAAYGEQLLAPAEEKIIQEYPWKRDAFTASALFEALELISERLPQTKPAIIKMLRARLERYRTNAPLLNSFLLNQLVDFHDLASLPLVQKIFEEDFCDPSLRTWAEVRREFSAEKLPEKISPPDHLFTLFKKEPYMGDESFSRAIHSAGLQGSLLNRKAFVLGSILSPGSSSPTETLKDFFTDPFTEEEVEWETDGQHYLLMHQFFFLWNQMADFQSRRFPLEEFLGKDGFDRDPESLTSFLSLFFLSFLDGLALEEEENYPFTRKLNELLKKLETLREEKANSSAMADLAAEMLNHWKNKYLEFAKQMCNERAAMVRGLERREGQPDARVSVGRNDPCPCGSGKKFKKCCL